MSSQFQSESSNSYHKGHSKSKNLKKLRSLSPYKSNQESDSSDFDESKCLKQNKPLLYYYNQKRCEICLSTTDESNIYFCDKCDDGYHAYCIEKQQQKPSSSNLWICPKCIMEEKQTSALFASNLNQIIEENSSDCYLCEEPLKSNKKQEVYFGIEPQKMLFQFKQKTKRCLHCQKSFHQDCFNKRLAALNCSKCEAQIRKSCPKGHFKFVEYYRKKLEVFMKENYLTLIPLQKQLWPQKAQRKRSQKLGLKIPSPVTNWQLITQYEASIYYAFETKNLSFTEDQIYNDPSVMDLNRWDRDCVPIYELDQQDQKAFETFKENTRNGVIVGPYEIKEDSVKGFHIKATDFIQKLTIITEYVGQVISARKSLFQHNKNDSIFMLIKNSRSSLSLDIVPHQFGNIARFFSGINNKSKEGKKLVNVEAIRFNYQGRMRIILYAKKNIQAGDQLFFDYNGGPFHEYPTDNFKH